MPPLHHPATARGRHPVDADLPTTQIRIPAGATATRTGSAVPAAAEDQPRLNLSLTQILAGTAAAVTAALLGSRLGVAGTLTGAALASVVSAVGSAIFGHSLMMTRRRLRAAAATVRSTGVGPVNRRGQPRSPDADAVTVVLPAITRADLARAVAPTSGRSGSTPIERADAPLLARSKRLWRKALLVAVAASLAFFAAAVGTVTVAEAIKGSPLSGGAEGGLSVLGGGGGATGGEPGGAPTPDPAPSTGPAPSTPSAPSTDSATPASPTSPDTPSAAAIPTAGGDGAATTPPDPTTEPASGASSAPSSGTSGSSAAPSADATTTTTAPTEASLSGAGPSTP